jgi:hypothetical protein
MDRIQKRWFVACRRLLLSQSNDGRWNGQFLAFDPWRPSDLTRWLRTRHHQEKETLNPIRLSQYEYDRWLSSHVIRRLLILNLKWFVARHPKAFDGSPEDYRTLLQLCYDLDRPSEFVHIQTLGRVRDWSPIVQFYALYHIF